MEVEWVKYYAGDDHEKYDTARILMRTSYRSAQFRGISQGWHVEGRNLLFVDIEPSEARKVENNDEDAIEEIVENTDVNGLYLVKKRAYIASRIAGLKFSRFQLHSLDKPAVEEYVPGQKGVQAVRSLHDTRPIN
jgi:hypothetical protein